MKRLVCVVLLALAGTAAADDLGDANRFLAAKAYDKALPLYQRLAAAGNPEAQFRLGEMYWFGDGTAADLGKARGWFERAAAAGNADAAASLASLRRRETHGADITYWTATYQGEDLVSGQYACQRPVFPSVSRTKPEIAEIDRAVATWRTCHNAMVDNLNDALPPGKRIPAEVLDMMTPAEALLAQRHLDGVYGKIIASAQAEAQAFEADNGKWVRSTQDFADLERVRVEQVNAEMRRVQMAGQRMDTQIPNKPNPSQR